MTFFHDLMPSLRLSRWTPSVLRKHLFNEETETIETLCQMMMASDGEYSSLLLAERILNAYEKLDTDGRLEFFVLLRLTATTRTPTTSPSSRARPSPGGRNCCAGSNSRHKARPAWSECASTCSTRCANIPT